MIQKFRSTIKLVSYLRWVVPFAIAVFGIGHVIFEQVIREGNSLFSFEVFTTLLVIGLAGPLLAWWLLTRFLRTAIAEADAQQKLAFRNRELAALNAIGEVTSQSLHLEEILRSALEKIVELMGLQAGEMRVVEADRLVLRASYGITPTKAEEKVVRLGQCQCGKCAQTGQTLNLNDLPIEPSLANTPCAKEGFRSIISVPMKTKEQVLGVILLASRNPSAIAETDQQILNAIGNRIALAVENARLYEKARRRAVHLETASLLGQRMTALLDLEPLLSEAVKLIRNKFGYYHVHIFLKDEDTGEIVLAEVSGPFADLIKARGLRLKIGQQGITGWVAHTGQTLVCNDVSREPRYYYADSVPDTKSELAIPLRVGTETIGVLDVQSNQRDAFDRDDIIVLQILANQIGIAVQNARLFQETKRRYNAMIALHETSLDMIAQLDTTKLLEALLRRGAQLLSAQAGSLFLYDKARDLVYNVANYNTWRDWTGVTMRPGEGVVGRVVQTGKPMIENDYANWHGKSAIYEGSPQTRVVSVPLERNNQIIGGINIINDSHGRPFDRDDVWLLTHFADLATLAIKNAELHTQVKEFSGELEVKVEERTQELSKAKNEIAIKADQLRSLLAKTIEIQEAERARIARDMHDGVVQLINATRYELHAVELVVGSGMTGPANEKMSAAYKALEEIEKEIRHTIYDLHPPILDAIGLVPALQKYGQRFQELSGITCQVQVKGSPYRLSPAIELAVFRMVEEALQNVAAHSNAQTVKVVAMYERDSFCIFVQDDGQGFDHQRWIKEYQGNHLGLLGMRERVQNLGGTMNLTSDLGHGTSIVFQLPIAQDEELA